MGFALAGHRMTLNYLAHPMLSINWINWDRRGREWESSHEVVKMEKDVSQSEQEASEKKSPMRADEPMGFQSWAAQPLPRKNREVSISGRRTVREEFDSGALKIFLILAILTAVMALGMRVVF